MQVYYIKNSILLRIGRSSREKVARAKELAIKGITFALATNILSDYFSMPFTWFNTCSLCSGDSLLRMSSISVFACLTS